MRSLTHEHKKLLFKHAVLSARIEIREFFLNYAVKEVYENIGQVLSLVRLQLAAFTTRRAIDNQEEIIQSGNLVGQSIRDLRSMCRNFYPDDDLLKEDGFKDVIELTLKILELSDQPVIIKGDRVEISDPLKLIGFGTLLHILIVIKEDGSVCKNLVLSYTTAGVTINIECDGELIDLDKKSLKGDTDAGLTAMESITIVGGEMNIEKSKNETTSIILQLPLNLSL